MTTLPLTLADSSKEIVLVGGMLIALVAMLFSFIRSISHRNARERTKREIAAYVAEGSMTAEEGERLLNAGEDTPE